MVFSQKSVSKWLFLSIFLSKFGIVAAQDPSFSQFYAVRSYLNPAMVGIQPGTSVNLAYRNQWFQIPGGFETFYGSVEFQEPNLNSAFGFSVFHDAEGQASLVTQRVAFNYNYFLTPNIQIGLEPSVTRKYLDWDKFIFPDQLDPVFGVSQTSVAVPILDRVYSFDLGTGMTYRGDLKNNGRYIIGVAGRHLWPWREESLQNLKAQTPMRLTLHGGVELPLTQHNMGDVRARHLTLLPSFKFDWHKPFQVLTLGCYVLYEKSVYLGVFNQHRYFLDEKNTNALSFVAGYKFPFGYKQVVDVGINYDANGTGLSLRSGGVVEMTMNVNFTNATIFPQGNFARRKKGFINRRNRGSKRVMDCRSFF